MYTGAGTRANAGELVEALTQPVVGEPVDAKFHEQADHLCFGQLSFEAQVAPCGLEKFAAHEGCSEGL